MAEREVHVHIALDGENHPVGSLWSHVRKGRQSASFEYFDEWLRDPLRFALEPALQLGPGPFHTGQGKALFGAFGDSAPDRWGRVLMRRAERRRAQEAGETPRTLYEIDYLLAVNDVARQGALRFAYAAGGAYQADESRPIPPFVELPKLFGAAERVLDDNDSDEDLKLLLAPGSSLGGARPKASVVDLNGRLAIAKFPNRDDEVDSVRWEAVALRLAEMSGIRVAPWRVETVNDKAVLLLERFDRLDAERIPFLSAMSILGANDNESHSYLEIADALRRFGASPSEDLHRLWRRIVFNILISNTDDHLRNHGFLYEGMNGWSLSPAYDLNPVPTDIRPRVLSTSIDLDENSASLDVAFDVAEYFALVKQDAEAIASEVGLAVSKWRKVALEMGVSPREIDRMSSAFEHEDARKAR